MQLAVNSAAREEDPGPHRPQLIHVLALFRCIAIGVAEDYHIALLARHVLRPAGDLDEVRIANIRNQQADDSRRPLGEPSGVSIERRVQLLSLLKDSLTDFGRDRLIASTQHRESSCHGDARLRGDVSNCYRHSFQRGPPFGVASLGPANMTIPLRRECGEMELARV